MIDDDDVEFGLDEVELHRTDDPDVWGLSDVARGRTPVVPTTIYKTAGDSASGVAGLLFPDSTFLPVIKSGAGERTYRLQDGGADDGQVMPPNRTLPISGALINAAVPTEFFGVVVWDGARKSDPVEVIDEDTGLTSLVQEHTKGLLLGDIAMKGASQFVMDRKRGKPQRTHSELPMAA